MCSVKMMQKITVVLTSVLIVGVYAVHAEVRAVYFLHKAATKSVLKLDCDEERNGTAPPVYTCYDNNGNEEKVTSGPQWQLVELSPACLLNVVTDIVDNSCAGVAKPGKQPMLYICQKDKEVFQVSEQWKPLPVDDDHCGSRKTDVVELIRGDSSTARPSQITWSQR